MKKHPRIAILASGKGSNFEAIASAIEKDKLNAEIMAVISDCETAPVLRKADHLGVPAHYVAPPSIPDPLMKRRNHEKNILAKLDGLAVDFLVLAGYMRMITPELLKPFKSDRGYYRVVNIHPSLLPAFPGVGSYDQAFAYGCHWTGVTVHLVDEEMDHGPICAQEAFSIKDCRSGDEVLSRGIEIEHRLYPETLDWVLQERFQVIERSLDKQRRVCVRQS